MKGSLRGPFRKKHSRAICSCGDCQAYARILKSDREILDSQGGTEIIALYPNQIHLDSGIENLKCLRLSEKGLFRWYAGCCHTPIANSPGPGMPFAGVVHNIVDLREHERTEVFGPIFMRFSKASLKLIATTLPFLLKGYWKKTYWPSPFYFPDGKPRVKPEIVRREE